MPLAPLSVPSSRRRGLVAALAVAATTASTLAVATLAAPAAHAATSFTPDDVVVARVGTGAAALTSAATASFLDEFSPTGAAVQSIALPTTSSGATKALTNSGSASSEELLSLSPNGRFLTTTGYNAPVGTTGVTSTTSASTSRTVAIVGTSGAVDTSTSLTDAFSANNIRSAATIDGSAVWAVGANSGVRYAVKGSSTSAQVSDTASGAPTNFRQVQVVGGQLYVSSGSATPRVATVGTGTPTAGPQSVTNLPGAIGASGTGPYQVAFLTLGTGTAPDTAYVADNAAGSVQKYSLAAGAWNATGSVSGLTNLTGVAANIYNNAVRIYATTPSGLYRFSDTSGQGGTLVGAPGAAIATAAMNTAFRGVAFAPGTTITSGLTPTPTVGAPTVVTAQPALAAALGDPTNPTLGATLAVGTNATYTAGQLTITASSSNASVAPTTGISTAGTGANRTITITPGAVGTSTITLTVSAPDGQSGTAAFTYGVSANQGDASDRYLAGAGNASAVVDVGGGYALVGDDESDVIRLYNTASSGLPVATFDYTAQLPFGNAEVDIEGAARTGNTIYWMGSMSTNSSGNVAPARSTVFATTVSGSAAATTLSYVGANTNLQTDLVNWDKSNGHGLGANYFGFDQSVNGGVANHANNAFNLEGLEFAKGSTTTAYLAFRAPIVPASNRTRALLVPVTNFTQLVSGNAVHGSFGAPIQWDLGGLGVRDIKAGSDGTFVVIAGTADSTNSTFVLYTWDGNPNDPPLPGQSLPIVPAAPNQGAWEAIVSVPSPLTAGSTLTLVEDDGDLAWYGNGQTSKSGLSVPLQKDLLRNFAYTVPSPVTTATTLTSAPNPATVNQQVTYTATVTAPSGTPRGAVSFSDGSTTVTGCSAQTLAADGTATCTVVYPAAGTHQITATYTGTSVYAASTSDPVTETVNTISTSTTLTASSTQVTAGDQVTFTASVTSAGGPPDGTVRFVTGNDTITGCGQVTLDATGDATCTTSFAQPGDRTVTARYLGSGVFGTSASDPVTVEVAVAIAPTTTSISTSDASVSIGESVTYTASVTAATGRPTGTVSFSEGGSTLGDCDAVVLGADGTAACTLSYPHAGTHQVVAAYSGGTAFGASTSDPVTEQVVPTSVIVTADDQTVTFGSPDPTFTYTVTPAVALTATPTCDVDGAHTAVDTYPISCSGADAGPDYSFSYVAGTLAVTAATTTVTVTADPSAPVAAQSVTVTATVGTGGRGTATGTVAFTVGGTTLAGCGAVPVDAFDVGTCTVDGGFLPGSVMVTAAYSGDASFGGSSGSIALTVGRAASATTVAVSPAAPLVGQAVTFTATVTGPGGIAPSGSVTITVDGSSATGCVDVGLDDSGQAGCVVQDGYAAGDHMVVATYSGDDNVVGSNDSASFSTVRATSALTVSVSPSSPVSGQPLTLTAVVTGVGPRTPTGSVSFTVNGDTGCGPVALDTSGRATCLLPGGLPAGSATVAAVYAGDGANTSATGSTVVTVGLAASTTTASADTAAPVSGQAVTFTAHVVASAPGSGTPTGTVAFSTGGGSTPAGCGAVAVDATGAAQCTMTAGFDPGSYTVLTQYSGDDDFSVSNGSVNVTVVKGAVSVAVTNSPNPPTNKTTTVFRAIVSPVAPATGTPTGTVTFGVTSGSNSSRVQCNGGNIVALTNGQATCVIPAGAISADTGYAATASYSGDTRFATGSGSVAQTVAVVATTTTVRSNLNPAATGAAVNLTATVKAASGSAKPTGTVTFTVTGADGTRVACQQSATFGLSAGTATCKLGPGVLRASNGPYQVQVVYSGANAFRASTGSASEQVRAATTKTTVAQSANSSPAGTPFTFTATVAPNTRGPAGPTGTVTFTVTDKAGKSVPCRGSAQIDGDGQATCTVDGADLVVSGSPYKVRAVYSADADYAPSTSAVVSHRVTKPGS